MTTTKQQNKLDAWMLFDGAFTLIPCFWWPILFEIGELGEWAIGLYIGLVLVDKILILILGLRRHFAKRFKIKVIVYVLGSLILCALPLIILVAALVGWNDISY